jgi:23S rRNA pseudouridine1911/1915/1917 synthase
MSEQRVSFTYHGSKIDRLDKVLVTLLPDYSRTRLQGLIKNGSVWIDDQIVNKTGFLIEPGSNIFVRIPAPEPIDIRPEAIPLDIVFENNDVMIINKPAGMVVHPSAGHGSGTLVHAALAHAPEMEGVGGVQRPGIVHRLDKETSGLILVAKNDRTHRWLQEQFRQRQVKKVYLALVDGHPPTPEGKIDAPIARDIAERKRMAVVPVGRGRDAISEYYTLETFPEHTLLEVHPLTGRTHQIRLHLAFLKCPVVGDKIYGRRRPSLAIRRQFLHAARVSLRLAGETEPRSFEAPVPNDLVEILDTLRQR